MTAHATRILALALQRASMAPSSNAISRANTAGSIFASAKSLELACIVLMDMSAPHRSNGHVCATQVSQLHAKHASASFGALQIAFVGFSVQALVTREQPVEGLLAHMSSPFNHNILYNITHLPELIK